mgnify:CR=1 FL=1
MDDENRESAGNEVFHDSIELVVHDVDKESSDVVKQALIKKWFIRWRTGVRFYTKRTVNDSDSNPSDSNSSDIDDDDEISPQCYELEHYDENSEHIQYKKLSYTAVENNIDKYHTKPNEHQRKIRYYRKT